MPLFDGARLRVPFRRHRRHRARRSSGRSSTCRPTCRAPCTCSSAARTPGCRSSSMRPPRRATAWPPRRRAKIIRSRRSILTRCRKYQGEQACFHWHQVYRLPVNSIRIFNAYGTRSRTSGAYGAVFGVFLEQKLAGKPFTVVGDGTQTRDFLYVTDVARAFLGRGRDRHDRARSRTSVPATRSRSIAWSSCSAASVYISQAPGRARLHLGGYRARSRASWAGRRRSRSRKACAQIVADIDYWRDAPLWDPESIAKATKTWFEYLGPQRQLMMDASQPSDRTATRSRRVEELLRGDRPAAAQEEGDHVPRHVRPRASGTHPPPALRQEQGRHPGRQPHGRRAHHQGATTGPLCRRTCARSTSRRSRWSTTSSSIEIRRRSRTSRMIQPDYFAKGYEYTDGGLHPKTAGGDRRPGGLWRRVHLHAGRHRLLLFRAHRSRAARHRDREAADADGGRRRHVRPTCAHARQAHAACACTWSATPSWTAIPHCSMIGGMTKTPTH